ncbi:MAG: S53 family peptidase [Actinomycetota bacterium]|nr:S53 family peptidase [Actinomycetota bacterium]
MRARSVVAAVLALALAVLLAASCSGGAGGRSGLVAGTPSPYGRYVGPSDPAGRVSFSLVLRLPHQAALDRFLSSVSDPSSPAYGRYLDARAFGRRFGLSGAQIGRLEAELTGQGLRVTGLFPQRTSLGVEGPVGAVERLLRVRLGDFQGRGGRRFHAPLSTPVVPAALRGLVAAVAGLNTGPVPASADVPEGGLRPTDAARAYDVTPLHDRGIQGQGQAIAIVSFASFRDQDVRAFADREGLPPRPPEHVPVDGGSTETTGQGSQEVNLDLDVVRGMAPQAQVLDYEAPLTSVHSFAQGTADVINRIVADGRAHIVSMSWGLCDVPRLADGTPWLSAGDRLAGERALQAAVAAGITVFVASGDTGAFGCQRFDLTDTRPVPLWPGDSPNVVSVGGTLLSIRQNGSYLEETGWEDILSGSGTGGGVNPVDPLPSFQRGVADAAQNPRGHRQVPDVAAAADPDSGFLTIFPDPKTKRTVAGVVGGTSAATPFWASSMLLIQQFAQQQGAGALGFVDPLLYRLAASTPSAFHDVTIGGNRLESCGPGWDFATGLGSPDVFALAKAMLASLGG